MSSSRRPTRLALRLSVAALVLAGGGAAHAGTGGPGGTFTDDDGSPHEGYIEAIVAEGITGGCATDPPRFCPGTMVSRGQLASFLARALDLPPASRDYFLDDNGSPHEDNTNRVAEARITRGDASGRYNPAGSVTRDQMASFLVRAFSLAATSEDRFTDDTGNVHEANINAVAVAGITSGCGTSAYCPSRTVVRAQMASFLGRALRLTPQTPAPSRTFGPGTQRVGTDISAGTYRSGPVEDACYWERKSGFGGSFDEIIANDFTTDRTIVTISESDAGFESDGCGTWTNDLRAITPSPTAPFAGGTFLVGTDVAPGTWQNSDSSGGCYWERLSGFGGTVEEIIANDFTESQAVVEIGPEDTGFSSNDCGTWTQVG